MTNTCWPMLAFIVVTGRPLGDYLCNMNWKISFIQKSTKIISHPGFFLQEMMDQCAMPINVDHCVIKFKALIPMLLKKDQCRSIWINSSKCRSWWSMLFITFQWGLNSPRSNIDQHWVKLRRIDGHWSLLRRILNQCNKFDCTSIHLVLF